MTDRDWIEAALTWGDPVPAGMNSDRKVLAKRLEQTVRQFVAEAHESRGLSR